MRILAAWIAACLGVGAMISMAACSDSTSDAGGAGGGSTAGASGAATAGSTHTAGATSSGGADNAAAGADDGAGGAACGFESDMCVQCLGQHCLAELAACQGDSSCSGPLSQLDPCVCSGSKSVVECQTTFIQDGKAAAQDLATCYQTNCSAACQ